MDAMLPALPPGAVSLADVLPSCRDALDGKPNTLGLPAMRSAIVVLIDGLGLTALRRRIGHARFLAGAMTPRDRIVSGFPTTTAAGIASLCTGARPGRHGLVGYRVLDRRNDRVVNQLSGWDERMPPETWQRCPTVFERARRDGVACTAIGQAKHRASGFTRAVLRGADYVGADPLADRVDAAARIAGRPGRRLTYLYIHELDMIAHARGCEGEDWSARLEEVDGALAGLARSLGRGVGALLVADHGIRDVPQREHVLVDTVDGLMDGVRHLAGEPRCLHLHLEEPAAASGTAACWRDRLGDRAWVATREEAESLGWFGGPVDPEVAPRIGDVLVAGRGSTAFYDSRTADPRSRTMVGQHGSLTEAETVVPLIRVGAAAG